jgi:hypothetical protein
MKFGSEAPTVKSQGLQPLVESAGVSALDIQDGQDMPEGGSAENQLINACDSNGDGVVDGKDLVVKLYDRALPLDQQAPAVQDALAVFDARGTLADTYGNSAKWHKAFAAYLAFKSGFVDVDSAQSGLTMADLDKLLTDFQDATNALNPTHSRLDDADATDKVPAKGDVTLDQYGEGVSMRFAGYVGSLDTSQPLVVGRKDLEIRNNADGTYSVFDGDVQAGTITQGSTILKLDPVYLDSLETTSGAGYQVRVPFKDQLSGSSEGTAWVAVSRSASANGNATQDSASGVGGLPSSAQLSAMANAASAGSVSPSPPRILTPSANAATPDKNKLADVQGIWIGAGIWVLVVLALAGAGMYIYMRRRNKEHANKAMWFAAGVQIGHAGKDDAAPSAASKRARDLTRRLNAMRRELDTRN